MPSPVQEQTQRYFSEQAVAYVAATAGQTQTYVVSTSREQFVLRWAQKQNRFLRFLDLGCGNGSLLNQLAERGHRGVGVDFSEAFISCARSTNTTSTSQNEFIHANLLNEDLSTLGNFDAVIAMGLIEYFSAAELHGFLSKVAALLSQGATLLLHARNRLFNVYSGNDYTTSELNSGALVSLEKECRHWAQGGGLSLADDLPESPRSHQGLISVSHRRQFTPNELHRLLLGHGLEIRRLRPVHFHALPPSLEHLAPQAKDALNTVLEAMETVPTSLLPQCSSFLCEIRRAH